MLYYSFELILHIAFTSFFHDSGFDFQINKYLLVQPEWSYGVTDISFTSGYFTPVSFLVRLSCSSDNFSKRLPKSFINLVIYAFLKLLSLFSSYNIICYVSHHHFFSSYFQFPDLR